MTMEWPGFQGGPMPDAFDDLMQGALIESPRGVGPLPSAEESAIVGATAARIGAGEIVAMPLVHRLLRSVAAGKAARPTAQSAGEILHIMPTQPTTMMAPRAAATEWVVATFCSACVSADSRLSSSPLRVTSKKASS